MIHTIVPCSEVESNISGTSFPHSRFMGAIALGYT